MGGRVSEAADEELVKAAVRNNGDGSQIRQATERR